MRGLDFLYLRLRYLAPQGANLLFLSPKRAKRMRGAGKAVLQKSAQRLFSLRQGRRGGKLSFDRAHSAFFSLRKVRRGGRLSLDRKLKYIKDKDFFRKGARGRARNAPLIVATDMMQQEGYHSTEGLISMNGAISADLIDSDGMVCADSIVGDTVNIRSAAGRFVKWIMAKKSTVRLIEAANVTISKLDAETVNGENVTIGPKCRVKTVDCSDNLTIDPTAVVETIVKN